MNTEKIVAKNAAKIAPKDRLKRKRIGSGASTFGLILALGAFVSSIIPTFGREFEPLNPDAPDRLPIELDGRPIAPDLGCFWSFELDGEKYKDYIDAVGPIGAFDSLVLTLRNLPTLDGNAQAVETTRKAVEYARKKFGVGTLLDVDLRIARSDFEKKFPDLLQERLFFQTQDVADGQRNLEFVFETPNLYDHYTGNYPYFVRGARLVRVWSASRNEKNGEILPETISDVSTLATVAADPKNPGRFVVSLDESALRKAESSEKTKLDSKEYRDAFYVAVAFRYSYPDVFADETLELERRLYEQFRDVPAAGIAKDEWGFPPNFNRVDDLNDFWFSEKMNAAFCAIFLEANGEKIDGKRTDADLVDALFLAFRPQMGRDAERIDVLDRYRKLCAERALEYEIQNYRLTKEIWGPNAFAGVHCTWYPWPNRLEMRKNGLMWWKTPRDFAQTDEYVPFCCRNSLAKATDSLWINMFYARQVPPYIREHWTAAASGGRVHIHQIYPQDENSPTNPRDSKMLPIIDDGGVARIRSKIRMLNLISNAPIDAPVAVVFGRYGVMNPLRPQDGQVGVDLCDLLATRGFPADLIPSDEIESTTNEGAPRWKLNDDNYLQYGPQQYSQLVFFGENDVDAPDFAAIRKLAGPNCETKITTLPATATSEERDAFTNAVVERLIVAKIAPQTPWITDGSRFDYDAEIAARPPVVSTSRFVDGTILWIAAEKNALGDQIELNETVVPLDGGAQTLPISAVANGVFAVRFDKNGELNAVVASELKSLRVGEFDVELTETEIGDAPIDVAIWRDANGVWRGVFQRETNALPKSLEKLAQRWNYLERRR